MASGRSPTVMCRPAGLILQPLGRSVEPREWPGRSAGFFACAGAMAAARKTQSPESAGRKKGLTGRG